jgi:hypothetical protein
MASPRPSCNERKPEPRGAPAAPPRNPPAEAGGLKPSSQGMKGNRPEEARASPDSTVPGDPVILAGTGGR